MPTGGNQCTQRAKLPQISHLPSKRNLNLGFGGFSDALSCAISKFFLIIILWAGSFLLGSRLLKGSAALANLIRILVDAAKPTAQLRLSILIALYRETEMVDQLIGQIRHLTCPASQLEVFLLAEQSDTKPTLH